MVLEGYIGGILRKYTHKYLANVDTENLPLWSGDIVLRDVELRLDVLQEELDLPVTFTRGYVKLLRIKLPITTLLRDAIEITADTVEIIATLKETSATSTASGEKNGSQQQQQQQSASATDGGATATTTTASTTVAAETAASASMNEDMKGEEFTTSGGGPPPAPSSASLGGGGGGGGKESWIISLLTKVALNIRANVVNLNFKFYGHGYVSTVSVKSLSAFPTNADWERAFVDYDGPTKILRRVFEVVDLTWCIDSLSPSSSQSSNPSTYYASFLPKSTSSNSNTPLPPQQPQQQQQQQPNYEPPVLNRMCCTVRTLVHCSHTARHSPHLSGPTTHVDIHCQGLSVAVSETQLMSLLSFMEDLMNVADFVAAQKKRKTHGDSELLRMRDRTRIMNRRLGGPTSASLMMDGSDSGRRISDNGIGSERRLSDISVVSGGGGGPGEGYYYGTDGMESDSERISPTKQAGGGHSENNNSNSSNSKANNNKSKGWLSYAWHFVLDEEEEDETENGTGVVEGDDDDDEASLYLDKKSDGVDFDSNNNNHRRISDLSDSDGYHYSSHSQHQQQYHIVQNRSVESLAVNILVGRTTVVIKQRGHRLAELFISQMGGRMMNRTCTNTGAHNQRSVDEASEQMELWVRSLAIFDMIHASRSNNNNSTSSSSSSSSCKYPVLTCCWPYSPGVGGVHRRDLGHDIGPCLFSVGNSGCDEFSSSIAEESDGGGSNSDSSASWVAVGGAGGNNTNNSDRFGSGQQRKVSNQAKPNNNNNNASSGSAGQGLSAATLGLKYDPRLAMSLKYTWQVNKAHDLSEEDEEEKSLLYNAPRNSSSGSIGSGAAAPSAQGTWWIPQVEGVRCGNEAIGIVGNVSSLHAVVIPSWVNSVLAFVEPGVTRMTAITKNRKKKRTTTASSSETPANASIGRAGSGSSNSENITGDSNNNNNINGNSSSSIPLSIATTTWYSLDLTCGEITLILPTVETIFRNREQNSTLVALVLMGSIGPMRFHNKKITISQSVVAGTDSRNATASSVGVPNVELETRDQHGILRQRSSGVSDGKSVRNPYIYSPQAQQQQQQQQLQQQQPQQQSASSVQPVPPPPEWIEFEGNVGSFNLGVGRCSIAAWQLRGELDVSQVGVWTRTAAATTTTSTSCGGSMTPSSSTPGSSSSQPAFLGVRARIRAPCSNNSQRKSDIGMGSDGGEAHGVDGKGSSSTDEEELTASASVRSLTLYIPEADVELILMTMANFFPSNSTNRSSIVDSSVGVFAAGPSIATTASSSTSSGGVVGGWATDIALVFTRSSLHDAVRLSVMKGAVIGPGVRIGMTEDSVLPAATAGGSSSASSTASIPPLFVLNASIDHLGKSIAAEDPIGKVKVSGIKRWMQQKLRLRANIGGRSVQMAVMFESLEPLWDLMQARLITPLTKRPRKDSENNIGFAGFSDDEDEEEAKSRRTSNIGSRSLEEDPINNNALDSASTTSASTPFSPPRVTTAFKSRSSSSSSSNWHEGESHSHQHHHHHHHGVYYHHHQQHQHQQHHHHHQLHSPHYPHPPNESQFQSPCRTGVPPAAASSLVLPSSAITIDLESGGGASMENVDGVLGDIENLSPTSASSFAAILRAGDSSGSKWGHIARENAALKLLIRGYEAALSSTVATFSTARGSSIQGQNVASIVSPSSAGGGGGSGTILPMNNNDLLLGPAAAAPRRKGPPSSSAGTIACPSPHSLMIHNSGGGTVACPPSGLAEWFFSRGGRVRTRPLVVCFLIYTLSLHLVIGLLLHKISTSFLR